jgi:hypothetical protein
MNTTKKHKHEIAQNLSIHFDDLMKRCPYFRRQSHPKPNKVERDYFRSLAIADFYKVVSRVYRTLSIHAMEDAQRIAHHIRNKGDYETFVRALPQVEEKYKILAINEKFTRTFRDLLHQRIQRHPSCSPSWKDIQHPNITKLLNRPNDDSEALYTRDALACLETIMEFASSRKIQ